MLIILSLLFVAFILFALKQEKRKFNTPSSPLMLVVFSNMSILVLYYVTQHWLGFHPLRFKTFFILLYGCFIFALVSIVFSLGGKYRNTKKGVLRIKYITDAPGKGLKVITILTIVFMFLKIKLIGLDNLMSDEDAQAQLGGGGLSGHVLVLQILLLTHILGMKLSIRNLPYIAGLFTCLLLYQVKVWILAPLFIGWFLHRDLRDAKIKIWQVVIIPVLIFGIFVGTYSLSLGIDENHMDFLWAHFCGYVFAGIGGLNEAVSLNLPTGNSPWYGIPSFISIPLSINVEPHDAFSMLYINDITNNWSNVFSLAGGCWFLNGLFIGTAYLIVIAFISYYLYNIRLRSRNYWFYLAYYLWAIGLILSFYGNYYTLLSIYELTVWSYVIGIYKSNKRMDVTQPPHRRIINNID